MVDEKTVHTPRAIRSSHPEYPEDIRLVIWDLDETFWRGTLTEGGITLVDAHCELVRGLAERGIMSSICSKNDFHQVKTILEADDLWRFFIFPSIDWSPKAPRIEEQIAEIGLRPASVLFIDDNPQNLHQAKALVPGLNVADPSVIPRLMEADSFRGKADAGLSRLSQYKNNEKKFIERKAFSGENIAFLESSDIRVYFEYDLEKHIDRIIELINRTNQLNFTKERLPEDGAAARAALLPFLRHNGTTAALVKVVDKFGDYGFVGFYAMTECNRTYSLRHFCFSCRTLNMYIEHFVYDFIGRPQLAVVGEVLSDVQSNDLRVDWIKALPIGKLEDQETADVRPIASMYVRGGCDLMALLHYFNLNCKDIVGEFNGIKHWQPLRLDHSSFLLNALEGLSADELAAAEELGYDADDFATRFPRDEATAPEVCLLSFWADVDIPVYRHRATGLELPYVVMGSGKADLRGDERLLDRLDTNETQRPRIDRLRDAWDYCPGLSHAEMVTRYRRILSLLPSKTRVFMTLANERHPGYFSNRKRFPLDRDHIAYNRALREATRDHANVTLVDFSAYVRSVEDILDINHLRRDLYFQVYQDIVAALDGVARPSTATARRRSWLAPWRAAGARLSRIAM